METLRIAVRRLKEDIYELRFAVLGISAYYLLVHFLFGQFCPMMIVLHFPCPGCGMTRALFLVLRGCFGKAWRMQPLIYGWMILGIWFVVNRYILDRRSRFMRAVLVLLLLGTLGVYGWRIFYGFPPELLKA